MKKSKLLTLVAMSCIMGLSMLSCQKGDTGPAGLDGAQGSPGAQGNANVHVLIHTVADTMWNQGTLGTSAYLYTSFNDPYIDQEVADSGAVLIYEGSGTSWQALPYGFADGGAYEQLWGCVTTLNTVRISYARTDGSLPSAYNLLGIFVSKTYKVVSMSSSARKANPDINWNNYEEVKQAFNLKD